MAKQTLSIVGLSLVASTFALATGGSQGAPAAMRTQITLQTSRIGDASHFEFSGTRDWKYDLKRDGNRVNLRLSGLKQDSLQKLRGYTDAIVKKVKINENGIDGQAEVTFEVDSKTDFFDYLTDDPSRLIVDFFPKDEPKGSTPELQKKNDAAKKAKPVVSRSTADEEEDSSASGSTKDISAAITGLAAKKKNSKRDPAGTDFVVVPQGRVSKADEISGQKDFQHGIFDGGDPEFRRFSIKDYEIKENAIIASRLNYYLPFPMLELGNAQLKGLIDAPPTYEIVPNDSRENKEARILLTLYSAKKKALFLKTAGEFLKKYPKSEYDEIVRYMVADTHYSLWNEEGSSADFEVAMGQYLLLAERYPQSPVTPRTLLFMGYAYVDRGDSFGALKTFQRFTRMNPTSKHIDQVKIAMAEAYTKLNRFDDALQTLDDVIKTARTPKAKQDAAFRKGNVYFRKKDWPSAIAEFKAAQKSYPDAIARFPNADYNIAEAEFRQNKYREALEGYRQFLQRFPDHEHGGYAMTRMGELLGILGADEKRAQGAFLESYFRYRSSPGAGIARIRTLTSRMSEMKDKELASALGEVNSITKTYANRPGEDEKPTALSASDGKKETKPEAKPTEAGHGDGAVVAHAEPSEEDKVRLTESDDRKKPELPGIEEFSTLLIADGYTSRKEFDRAAQDLIVYYQKYPQSPNKDRIVRRIVGNITEGIRAAVDRGDFMDALRRYSKNSQGWLKNTDRVDVRFAIGRAYEQSGVLSEASKIYSEVLKRLADLRASGEEKEHSVTEKLPRADEIHLRLAVVSLKNKAFSEAENHLKNVSSPLQLSEPEQIERAEVSAQVAEARGRPDVAIKYVNELINAWSGDEQLTSPLHLRMARLQIQAKEFAKADEHLKTVIDLYRKGGDRRIASVTGSEASETVAQALEMRGDLFVTRGKRKEAAQAYRDLLREFEGERSLAAVRYRLGRLFYEDGDLKSAQSEWQALQPEKDGMWAKLATEQMQSAKWQSDYKKYLNRIPAAAEMREGK